MAICSRHSSASEACHELIERASELWAKADGGGYRDDITCIVVFLPVLEKLAAHSQSLAAPPERVEVLEEVRNTRELTLVSCRPRRRSTAARIGLPHPHSLVGLAPRGC